MIRDSVKGQTDFDKSPTRVNCQKTERRDEGLSGEGKSRSKNSEVRMNTGCTKTRK